MGEKRQPSLTDVVDKILRQLKMLGERFESFGHQGPQSRSAVIMCILSLIL